MDEIDRKWVSQTHKLDRFREIFEQVKGIPGDLAEFGVYHGNGSRELASLDRARTVWAFDTFSGMPTEGYNAAIDSSDPPGKWKPQASVAELFEGVPNVKIVQGEFRETLLEPYPDLKLVLVHIDCDWYSSHKLVLEFLENHLQPGAHVVFDDFYLTGAYKAIKEWSEKMGSKIIFPKEDELIWQ